MKAFNIDHMEIATIQVNVTSAMQFKKSDRTSTLKVKPVGV